MMLYSDIYGHASSRKQSVLAIKTNGTQYRISGKTHMVNLALMNYNKERRRSAKILRIKEIAMPCTVFRIRFLNFDCLSNLVLMREIEFSLSCKPFGSVIPLTLLYLSIF